MTHSRWCISLVSVLVLICIALLFSTHYTKYTLPTILSTEFTPVHKLIVRPSGLRFFDLIVGVGDSPVNGEKVSVHYVHYYAAPGENVTTENYGEPPAKRPLLPKPIFYPSLELYMSTSDLGPAALLAHLWLAQLSERVATCLMRLWTLQTLHPTRSIITRPICYRVE